ncbi:MAG: HEAT repeat domain-containing protein [Planctomycetes bacterium]|nr:HEAT repeat domain-containing protein [Planctomycetota bacterium]
MYDQETDKTIKDKAFECLQNIGKPAQPFLLKLLTSQDATVRHGAILGLKNIVRDDASAAAPLLEPLSKLFLTETSAETLQEAADFLRTAGAKSEGTFLDGLKSPQEAVRLHSIRGLQDLRPAAALEPLSRLYEGDPSEPVRRKAGEVLEEYGAEAEPVFLRALSNTNAEVRMRAIAGLGNIKSEKPYETIAELFRTEKDPALHQRAFDYLAKVGRRAEKELLLALKDENQEIRREAIRALGLARSEAAIVPLIELLGDLNPEVVERSMDALVRIGPKATGAVEAAAAEGKVKKKSAEGILAKFHQEEIENILQKLVTEQGGTGFFEGQFADLEKFGKERALPILLRMGTDPGYQFRILDWKGGEKRNQMALRELAVMATGVLGYKEAVKSLKEALAGRVYTSGDEEYEIFVVTLYRLGEKGFYEALARKLAKDAETGLAAEDKTPVFNHLFSLALLQNRVGERREALATYEKLIELIEANKALWCRKCDRGLEKADVVEGNCKECGQAVQQRITTDLYSSALYNVACLCSLLDEKDKAVRALERAVDAGFDDRQWIEMDRDLEGIRGEEAYRKLMADAKRFEKPAPGSE